MGLRKMTVTEHALQADYYKVLSYQESFEDDAAHGVYGLYASKIAKDSGAKPIAVFNYSISLDLINSVDARQDVYAWLKTNALEGAVDE
jgi:5-methylcytosine-specific restriction endonuclease McrBC regulatory subunit McrC